MMVRHRVSAVLLSTAMLALNHSHVDAASAASSDAAPIDTPAPITDPPLRLRDVMVVSRVETNDPVVFITIDDGFTPTSQLAQVIAKHRVPITTFAMPRLLKQHASWFLAREQMTFENHTGTHGSLTRRSLRFQKREICQASYDIEEITGEFPVFFRPPGGNFTTATRRALAYCGIPYLVMWSAIAEHGVLHMPAGRLRRGEIILMHYIPSAATTLEKLLIQIEKDGLTPALLRDYLDQ